MADDESRKELFDIEKFPDSEAAKRMVSYVTCNWYEHSYIGKWVYEVIGREIDAYQKIIEELPYQFFIDTATWGLRYHEIKYGLTVREDLSYEERRARIKAARDTRYSISPWEMEHLVKLAYGITIHVHDCNEPGWEDAFEHPNIFEVDVEGDGAYKVLKYIKKLKQSHTTFRTIAYKNRNSDLYIGVTQSSTEHCRVEDMGIPPVVSTIGVEISAGVGIAEIDTTHIDDVGLHPEGNTTLDRHIGAATASIVTTVNDDTGIHIDPVIISGGRHIGAATELIVTTTTSDKGIPNVIPGNRHIGAATASITITVNDDSGIRPASVSISGRRYIGTATEMIVSTLNADGGVRKPVVASGRRHIGTATASVVSTISTDTGVRIPVLASGVRRIGAATASVVTTLIADGGVRIPSHPSGGKYIGVSTQQVTTTVISDAA